MNEEEKQDYQIASDLLRDKGFDAEALVLQEIAEGKQVVDLTPKVFRRFDLGGFGVNGVVDRINLEGVITTFPDEEEPFVAITVNVRSTRRGTRETT